METKKFENGIKKALQEREIKPSAEAWGRLEQRLEREKSGSTPYFLWIGAAAAIAVVFFMLGSYFNSPIISETPQIVIETPVEPSPQEKITEPEAPQIVASEVEEFQEKTSSKSPVKNDIFETPVSEASEEKIAVVSKNTSEVSQVSEERVSEEKPFIKDLKTEIAAQDFSSEVSDLEIEALLLLATAELKADPAYTVRADDLLHQVEYELEQSFRQKVFEVVKEGLQKAKTAVANRDF